MFPADALAHTSLRQVVPTKRNDYDTDMVPLARNHLAKVVLREDFPAGHE